MDKAEIKIDTGQISPEAAECIGRAACQMMMNFLKQPGAREKLDEWKRTHGLEKLEEGEST